MIYICANVELDTQLVIIYLNKKYINHMVIVTYVIEMYPESLQMLEKNSVLLKTQAYYRWYKVLRAVEWSLKISSNDQQTKETGRVLEK